MELWFLVNSFVMGTMTVEITPMRDKIVVWLIYDFILPSGLLVSFFLKQWNAFHDWIVRDPCNVDFDAIRL